MLVAWGFTDQGERVLLSVMLGMRESHQDWLALGCDFDARGLGVPMLIVADGAPGLDQSGRAVLARLGPPSTAPCTACATCWPSWPERERERVRQA